MMSAADKEPPMQALVKLWSMLKKPYQDVCNVCKGVGKITETKICPKCKKSGRRLIRPL